MKNKFLSVIIAVSLAAVSAANAALTTFDLAWSGVGNGATATGSITFDTSLVNNPGYNDTSSTWAVTSLDVEISGTAGSAGDGIFSLGGDIFDAILFALAPVDFGSELVGQAGFIDFNVFGSSISGSAANVFKVLATDEDLKLTSFKASVPDHGSTLALFGLGLAGLGFIRRKIG